MPDKRFNLFGKKKGKPADLPGIDDLRSMVQKGFEHSLFSSEQRQMLLSILEIGQIPIREVMVPRVDMVALEAEATIEDILYQFKLSGYSRLPVYDGTIENIIGVVYVRDLLRFWSKRREDLRAVEFIRLPHFIPSSKKVLDALREFRKQRITIAMVIDEYGALEGMVTMDDLLEEIVGELQDEFTQEERLYRKQDDGSYLVDPRWALEEMEKVFSIKLKEKDIQSVGGLVLTRMGRVPLKGEKLAIGPLGIEVVEATKQKIQRLVIREKK
jgi:CBS domain containing-hemolysin-like protein